MRLSDIREMESTALGLLAVGLVGLALSIVMILLG